MCAGIKYQLLEEEEEEEENRYFPDS